MTEKGSEDGSALAAVGMGIAVVGAFGFAFFNAPGMIMIFFIAALAFACRITNVGVFDCYIGCSVRLN